MCSVNDCYCCGNNKLSSLFLPQTQPGHVRAWCHIAWSAQPGLVFALKKTNKGKTPSTLPAFPACGCQEAGSPTQKKEVLGSRAARGTCRPGCQATPPHHSQTSASGFHWEGLCVYTAVLSAGLTASICALLLKGQSTLGSNAEGDQRHGPQATCLQQGRKESSGC